MKNKKLKTLIALAVWAIIAVGIYYGALSAGFFAITAVYPAVFVICAVIYLVIYWRIIDLRDKAKVSPSEKFDYKSSALLSDADKVFLEKSEKWVKAVMFIAVPVLFIMLWDFLYTMFLSGGIL